MAQPISLLFGIEATFDRSTCSIPSALKCTTTWAKQQARTNGMFTKESASEHGSKGVKNKTLSAASRKVYERAAAAAERKAVAAEAVAAEAKEGALGADAVEAALADALGARGAATKARARLGGAGTEEAKAAEARSTRTVPARRERTAASGT